MVDTGNRVFLEVVWVLIGELGDARTKHRVAPFPPTVGLATEAGPETSFGQAQITFTIENVRKSPTTKAGSPSFGADLGIAATRQTSFGSP